MRQIFLEYSIYTEYMKLPSAKVNSSVVLSFSAESSYPVFLDVF